MRTAVVVALAIVLAASSVARAAPIPPALSDSARGADLATIARALESRLVAAHLRALGLTPEAIHTHLARLDDGELHQMAQSLPELGVGGEQQELTPEQIGGVVLLLVVALAVVAGLVFLALAGPLF